jgi:hypothetical protein
MRAASPLPATTGIWQHLQKCPELGLFHLLSTPLRDTAQQQFGSTVAAVVLRSAAALLLPGPRRDARGSAKDQATPTISPSQLSPRFYRTKFLSALASSASP